MKNLFAAALLGCVSTVTLAEGVDHKIAVHVDQADPAVQNMALNNVQNLIAAYEAQGDTATVEVVAYGPGLTMYVAGKSPVADRIAVLSLEQPTVSFSACGNTHRAMSAKAGADVPLLPEAGIVASGVVRLVELQEQGYAYIRP